MLELKIGDTGEAMGWLEFVSSLVGSLAWPVAAVIIAILFRAQIAGLLNKIRSLSWGDKKIDFADKLDKIEDASREVAPEASPADAPASVPDQRFQQLLEISPAAAILHAWVPVQARLSQIAVDRNYGPDVLKSPYQTMKELRRSGVISAKIYQMLRDLQTLRNAAAHQREVFPADALRFYDLSNRVLGALERGESTA